MRQSGWDPVRGRWVMAPHGFRLRPPDRPRYREPHPVRAAAVWAGIGATATWFLFFAMLAWSARSYVWSTLIAGALAWVAAATLIRYGDRGVAVGVAAVSAVAVSIACLVVGVRYLNGDWILW